MRVAMFGILLAAACDVGSVLDSNADGGGGGGSGSGSGSGGGGNQPLQITVTTSPTPGALYAPAHVVAVWIENPPGTIIKTIGRYSAIRTVALVAWNQAAGLNDVDAVSGATLGSHTTALSFDWGLKDRQGATVPDGTYTVRMETADRNSTTAGENNQGTFTFVKGTQPEMQTGLSGGGFTNVSITFTP